MTLVLQQRMEVFKSSPSQFSFIMNRTFPPIILASKSPRRQELMKLLGIDFRIVLKEVDESYPEGMTPAEIAVYISEKKSTRLR